ncbi:pentaheme c-type cytochrome TorC [Ignatzschineria larvae DSM 13226]|uniref:Cytochrome c-type protein n=1 Tax=Ignatzschineria larvae DSM 13226 TaxID=1111732 RepID=A0ABZ3C1F3_9GAMM|nr:pentaheme c-type cytochrome TorC [Ignatzschineria larvae]
METFKRIKQALYNLFLRPSMRIGLGVLVTGGFIAGILFWNAFDTGLKYTNSEAFCISCHTMGDNVYPELQETVHFKNRTGVRAYCADCHVPHNFTDKIARKMQASREVWSHITGDIGTREKFLDKRLVLAQREWDRMNANGSKECRSCHDYKHMDFDKMDIMAQMEMKSAAERNISCIECHKGIAHQLPKVERLRDPALDDIMATAHKTKTSANHEYYNVLPQPLYLDEKLQEPIGSIETATAVKVLDKKGDAELIEFELWRKNKGYGRVWYEDFGLNIMSVILDKTIAQNNEYVEVLESKEDPLTGLEWQKVKASAWIKNGGLIEDATPLWTFADTSYNASCSVCHQQPLVDQFDTNTWPGIFNGMVGFTNLDNDSASLILKYLQLHSTRSNQAE